jgi:Fe-S oxidoreductase
MVVGAHLLAIILSRQTPLPLLCLLIQLIGLTCFAYILAKRLAPLLRAGRDCRFDRPELRLDKILQFWLMQWKQPRYPFAGMIHIAIFAGFLLLMFRSVSLVMLGFTGHFSSPEIVRASLYSLLKDYAATLVFLSVVVAAIRRVAFKPSRYAVPPQYGQDHTWEAITVLGLIGTLMISESIFEASGAVLAQGHATPVPKVALLSLAWVAERLLRAAPAAWLFQIHAYSFLLHDVTFFAFLCFLPLGKHFHVVTSLFNVGFAKLDCGTVKPVRWGVGDDQLDQVKSFGVKKFEDFTWKHILDFYSCADCGRCSDNCPANAVGRPLSPRFLTIKARDYSFQHYPIIGSTTDAHALIGDIYSEDEIWSCTTCGACEAECPLLIEYIDKIVDLRRGMVDDGNVPKSIQKALKAVESRGNPYGKLEKKKADWAKEKSFLANCDVRIANGDGTAETLYFVDSITSYDDRMQGIARTTARILTKAGENFAILGAAEKDSGHDVRRFGEETLFMALRDHNVDAIKASGVSRIVTSDPHAYNALKHDYQDLPPVEHISQVMVRDIKSGKLCLNSVQTPSNVYAYHDPCYLGRHNQVYEEPRAVLDAIPGLKRVEMSRCRDRSFCCGGGGLMLFYEPQEEQRMGVKRVQMAAEVGANVIVTACPFCLVNIEDAIKVAGMEGKMTALDLTELVDQHVAIRKPPVTDKERVVDTVSV